MQLAYGNFRCGLFHTGGWNLFYRATSIAVQWHAPACIVCHATWLACIVAIYPEQGHDHWSISLSFCLSLLMVLWLTVSILFISLFSSVILLLFPTYYIFRTLGINHSQSSPPYLTEIFSTYYRLWAPLSPDLLVGKTKHSNDNQNSSIPWSGRLDKASDWIIFVPGKCISLMSNSDR